MRARVLLDIGRAPSPIWGKSKRMLKPGWTWPRRRRRRRRTRSRRRRRRRRTRRRRGGGGGGAPRRARSGTNSLQAKREHAIRRRRRPCPGLSAALRGVPGQQCGLGAGISIVTGYLSSVAGAMVL
jgi:hypothetical protein